MRLTRSILPKNWNDCGPTRSVFDLRSKRKIYCDDSRSLSNSIDNLIKEVLRRRRRCDLDNSNNSNKITNTKKLLNKIKLLRVIPGHQNDPKPKPVSKINVPNPNDPMVDYLEKKDGDLNHGTVHSDEESESSRIIDVEKDEDHPDTICSYSDNDEDRDSIPSSKSSSTASFVKDLENYHHPFIIDLDPPKQTARPLEEHMIAEGGDPHVNRFIEFVATLSHDFVDKDNYSEDDRDEWDCEREDFDGASEDSSIESSGYAPVRNRLSGDDVDCGNTVSTFSCDSNTVIHAPRTEPRASVRPNPKPLVVMNNDRRNMLAWTRCAPRNHLNGGSIPFPIAYPKDETADDDVIVEESPPSSHTSQNNNGCFCCCFLG